MKRRNITARLEAALADTPVVLVNGPRQTGKTTLVESLVRGRSDARYFTFDDAAVLAAAAADPPGFLAGAEGLTVIDEVQKVPALFPAVKLAVDRDRRPGRFLLTGSAHVLMLPQISESLAGRMEILTLWPFSQGEIAGAVDGFVDVAFSDQPPRPGDAPALPDLRDRLLRGGYPEALERTAAERRRAWFASYVTTILQRDVARRRQHPLQAPPPLPRVELEQQTVELAEPRPFGPGDELLRVLPRARDVELPLEQGGGPSGTPTWSTPATAKRPSAASGEDRGGMVVSRRS